MVRHDCLYLFVYLSVNGFALSLSVLESRLGCTDVTVAITLTKYQKKKFCCTYLP